MNANIQIILWVVGTGLIGLAALNVAHKSGGGQIAKLAQDTASGHLTGELAAFVFYVGIPFVALIIGVLGLDHMALGLAHTDTFLGFTSLEWLRAIGITLGTTAFVLGVLWLMSRLGNPINPTDEKADAFTPFAILRTALYAEVHWAFYRSLGALLFHDAYWGAALGFGLIGLEWAMHPNFRLRIQSTEGRAQLAVQLVCLITSSALYLGAQNLWLMIAAHALIFALGQRWLFHHKFASEAEALAG